VASLWFSKRTPGEEGGFGVWQIKRWIVPSQGTVVGISTLASTNAGEELENLLEVLLDIIGWSCWTGIGDLVGDLVGSVLRIGKALRVQRLNS